jgi:TetR/AcrR family transcriptional regulator, tetracycline repressor protein
MAPAAAATAEPHDASATTRHAGRDRADVVQRALDLVEEGGAEALSKRKLAAELGVTTTTIYWHVGNRDELVIALIRRLADQQAEVEVVGTSAVDRITSAARNIWLNARAHRNVTALASQVGATTLLELPLEVTLVAELEAAGVGGTAARDALRAILMCIAGFLVGAWRPQEQVPSELRHGALWAGVDDERVAASTVAAMADPPDLDALFETTIRAVVATFVPTTKRTGGRR